MSIADSSITHFDMSDEHHLPPEEPQSNPHEQEPSASDPTFTSSIEPETFDPFLVDAPEKVSEEEVVEVTPSSDTKSLQIVSPTQALSFPSPKASIPQSPPPLPSLQTDIPSPSESEGEFAPDIFVPTLIVPTMFLPIPNVRRPFSSNLLTWWLVRNLNV
jgi:hypothetical protein